MVPQRLIFRSIKRAHDLFINDQGLATGDDLGDDKICKSLRASYQYGSIVDQVDMRTPTKSKDFTIGSKSSNVTPTSQALVLHSKKQESSFPGNQNQQAVVFASGGVIIPRKAPTLPKPEWHPPWKLVRVLSGHTGWVRALAVDPGNDWFASGSTDRLIKIWDLAAGTLKLSLTGHVSPVRGLAVSSRQPYLFSCGEDKQVKCWDLEYNKVIRHYHGHLSAVYAIALHPDLDVLVTGGRDKVGRLWDMRTKVQIHSLNGHDDTIASIQAQTADPQIITGSHDSTIRLWDIVAGKTMTTLTHHKKSVRALQFHPTKNMFVSGAPDNIKEWMCPDGKFVQNLSGHSCVNCLAVNEDNVLVSGGNDGSLLFWDWKTGYNFQKHQSIPQPGSMDSDNGLFALIFDKSGSRLFTGECDKTIKMYKEDEEATEETHPINWKPGIFRRSL